MNIVVIVTTTKDLCQLQIHIALFNTMYVIYNDVRCAEVHKFAYEERLL